ncbi:MAG: aminofutalosine synthase MqnE [Candidatus Latescibacteria bacterium]|nr:aminofutalosine synthase MqnE [Candidatus Latescibacterota bacterium]
MIPDSHPLAPVARKIASGTRLDERDGLLLAASDDLPLLGWLAHTVRERMHGRKVFYNINRHINPTNVCYVGCELCAYADDPNAPGTWSYSPQECVELARRDFIPGTSEFHIVGGLHPRWKFPVYLDILRALKQAFPDVHLKAFTMVEIDFLAKIGKLTVPETIAALREAGLDSCPGGGAEIFHPEIHDRIASKKMSGERWLEVAALCHEAGLKTNCTMLFGHVEEPRHWVHHLLMLRDQQDRTGGFQCFIPLAFHPAGTKFADLPGPTLIQKLKVVALSRLLLDNVPHVKAYWVMLGREVAQLALRCGADDLDGTISDERITLAAGGTAGTGMSRDEIEAFIRGVGLEPVLRDTLYNELATAG